MTYSLGATGRRAEPPFVLTNIKVGDAAGTTGAQQNAMMNGTPILCQRPDGSQGWYTIDADRSQPGALVMKAV